MLSPEARVGHILRLIEERKYFTVHAGRQTGKTTALQWLVGHINTHGRYCATMVDLQNAREQPESALAFKTVLNEFDRSLERDLPAILRPTNRSELIDDPASAVFRYLHEATVRSPKPLVVLFDEADGLVGPTMVSFLTQLRSGYIDRARTPFPHSAVLVGMRQVRDYAISTEERRTVSWLGTTSPFNITAEALTLRAFNKDEVGELLEQHTTATSQRFEHEAAARIFHLTRGHPWLVNALADQIVNRDVEDSTVAVTADHVETAKETIIQERRSHIDSLAARLREQRVRRVIEPMLMGEQTGGDVLDDDFAYVVGLGLVDLKDKQWQVANPVYREVIPRVLTYVRQGQLPYETSWYLRADGGLDMPTLLAAFQTFWRKDGHIAAQGFAFRAAGPHLMLMAFLQRIVNGRGRIEREYGLGRGALDLMVFWPSPAPQGERFAIEVKLRRDSETEADAIEQITRYLDTADLDEGWLVLFDLRKGPAWDERLYERDVQSLGKCIHIVGV